MFTDHHTSRKLGASFRVELFIGAFTTQCKIRTLLLCRGAFFYVSKQTS